MTKFILKHKILLLINFIFIVGIAIAEALQAILFKTIIDTVTKNNNYEFSYIISISLLFLLSVLILESGSKISAAALNKNTMIDYKNNIIYGFINKNMKSKVTNSQFISIMNNDVKLIEDSYLKSLTSISKDCLLFIISLFLLLRINIYLTISIIIFIWVPILLPMLLNKRNQNLKQKYSKTLQSFSDRIIEVAQGFDVIKSFSIEKKICELTYSDNVNLEKSKFNSSSFEAIVGATSITSGFFMFFINLLIAGYFVLKGDMTVGAMVAAVQLMNYIVNPISSISQHISKIKSVSKIIKSIDETILNSDYDEYFENSLKRKFEFNNEINMRDLSYFYKNQDKPALNKITLKIEKGKKYMIVGESGCGKTTLFKVLLNQIDGYTGMIQVDGVDLKSISPESIYNNITLIQQKIFMFSDTIKNNICLYNTFADNHIEAVIEKSGLTKVISSKVSGLNTILGENETQLSGGETQRIAIARALIKSSELLLIDEATSSLDSITTNSIQKTILDLNNTVISITHQLEKNILGKYDEIIVMKDGSIIEKGSLNELIDKKGYFYYMYNIDLTKKDSLIKIE